MTYATDTVSVQSSAPVELYDIVTPMATYRHTSFDTDFVYSGNTYFALEGLERKTIEVSGSRRAQDFEFSLPVSSSFVQENIVGGLPRDMTLTLRILQRLSGEAIIVWQGPITSANIEGRKAELLVPSKMDDALQAKIPSVRFQKSCNHFLYDAKCLKNATDFDLVTTASVIAGVFVTVGSVGGNPDHWFRAGEIVRAIDGERRLIVSQVGNLLRLNYAFRQLVAGNSVTLYAGCDHTIGTCRSKFSNHRNFGGHPHTENTFVKLVRLLLGKGT